ncbi:class I SAM-dependent methyltransferase [Mycolicibacterium hodleri]|uniref:Class I SAM-dependent methyltransferase n=1 Tax=Mycolicibacterium hodleri TaxID=49897 RepID=A0A502E9M9_9MYCO|nr:class I SAM-dependent methyltransferase [Mycolicibacterium hodleri]TPG33612.1 class I SAM-dependent methyltransferase [Mycolicibacterium hodleri]
MGTRWQDTDAPRGDEYDARWQRLAEAGEGIHGEADLVDDLLRTTGGHRVLDAGCGTGRVAVELARRGHVVVGIDADTGMLDAARAKEPEISWIHADLADVEERAEFTFDVVLLAGNVMIFLDPGSEAGVLRRLTSCIAPDGVLVAGFSIRPDRLQLGDYDRFAEAAGLTLQHRWATWDREPYANGDYAVSVHRRAGVAASAT